MRIRGFQGGVIEIISDGRPRYFSPTGYDRLRLIWAFRNFRRLPEPVLTVAQRNAIDRLSCTPEVTPTPSMVIIGAVERDSAAYKKAPQSDRSIEPLPVIAEQVVARRAAAAASTRAGAVVEWNPFKRKEHSRANPATADIPANARPVEIASSPSGSARKSNWALAVCSTWIPIAAVLILAVSSFFRLGPAPDPLVNDPPSEVVPPVNAALPAAADRTPSSAAIPRTPVLKASLPASATIAPAQAPVPATRHESGKAVVAAAKPPAPPVLPDAGPDLAQYSQSARRPTRMLYPNTPAAARLPGKVLLKATIGPGGSVENVSTLSGDPVVAAAAASAMKRWQYAGTGGQFETEVMFNFVDPDVTTIRFLGDKQLP